MREIKFRLHDKQGIIIGYEVHRQNEYDCWQIYQNSLRGDFINTNEEKLVREGYFIAAHYKVQYTGLEDINGKEIYEGEIIFNDDRKEHGVVEWHSEKGMFITQYEVDGFPLCDSLSNLYYSVGNVLENPELVNTNKEVVTN